MNGWGRPYKGSRASESANWDGWKRSYSGDRFSDYVNWKREGRIPVALIQLLTDYCLCQTTTAATNNGLLFAFTHRRRRTMNFRLKTVSPRRSAARHGRNPMRRCPPQVTSPPGILLHSSPGPHWNIRIHTRYSRPRSKRNADDRGLGSRKPQNIWTRSAQRPSFFAHNRAHGNNEE